MKYFNKVNKSLLIQAFTFIILIAVPIFFIFIKAYDEKILYSIIGSIIAAYFGWQKPSIENDRIFKDLFNEFNSKYDKDINNLFNKLRINEQEFDPINDTLLIIDYINLCSKEYLWYKKGRIPEDVWESWKNGMIANFKIKPVKNIYLD